MRVMFWPVGQMTSDEVFLLCQKAFSEERNRAEVDRVVEERRAKVHRVAEVNLASH